MEAGNNTTVTTDPPPQKTNLATLTLKILVSVAVLGFVGWRTDWNQLLNIWSGVEPVYLIPMPFIFLVVLVTLAVRFKTIIGMLDISISWIESLRVSYISFFFNNFGLANMGGDLYKMVYTAGSCGKKFNSVILVFLERLLGLAALVAFGIMVVPFADIEGKGQIFGAALILGLLLSLAVMFIFSAKLQRPFRKIFGSISIFEKAFDRLAEFPLIWDRGERKRLFSVFIISIPLHALTCIFVSFIGRALGIEQPFSAYLVYVPLIYLISALPISIGGLGIQELSFTAFFGPSEGLALALIFRFSLILVSIPAPLFWPKTTKAPDC